MIAFSAKNSYSEAASDPGVNDIAPPCRASTSPRLARRC